jgi:hypothetical protein
LPLFILNYFDGLLPGNSLRMNGKDGIESTQTSPNQGGSKKNGLSQPRMEEVVCVVVLIYPTG